MFCCAPHVVMYVTLTSCHNSFLEQNTVIVIVTGLGLLGLSTMFCDFVLLNYSPERKKVIVINQWLLTNY